MICISSGINVQSYKEFTFDDEAEFSILDKVSAIHDAVSKVDIMLDALVSVVVTNHTHDCTGFKWDTHAHTTCTTNLDSHVSLYVYGTIQYSTSLESSTRLESYIVSIF